MVVEDASARVAWKIAGSGGAVGDGQAGNGDVDARADVEHAAAGVGIKNRLPQAARAGIVVVDDAKRVDGGLNCADVGPVTAGCVGNGEIVERSRETALIGRGGGDIFPL